jgi:hypothetical protein
MIPRRQGFADINATIPVGDGKLPPIPEAIPDAAIAQNAVVAQTQPVSPSAANSGRILEALTQFSKISKKDVVDAGMLKTLTDKKLIVTDGDYAVVSEKGLKYVVDFAL